MKRMRLFHPRRWSLVALVWCLLGIFVGGVILAAATTPDNRWIGWSFSRLGEGKTLSSSIFNGSLLLATIVLWSITDVLSRGLGTLHSLDAARLTKVSLRAIAVCLTGVALFPNDTSHDEHLLFAHGIIVLFTLYALILPVTLANVSRRGRILAYTMPLLAIIISFRGFIKRAMPFVMVEVLIGAVAFCWFFMFCWFVQQSITKHNTMQ